MTGRDGAPQFLVRWHNLYFQNDSNVLLQRASNQMITGEEKPKKKKKKDLVLLSPTKNNRSNKTPIKPPSYTPPPKPLATVGTFPCKFLVNFPVDCTFHRPWLDCTEPPGSREKEAGRQGTGLLDRNLGNQLLQVHRSSPKEGLQGLGPRELIQPLLFFAKAPLTFTMTPPPLPLLSVSVPPGPGEEQGKD